MYFSASLAARCTHGTKSWAMRRKLTCSMELPGQNCKRDLQKKASFLASAFLPSASMWLRHENWSSRSPPAAWGRGEKPVQEDRSLGPRAHSGAFTALHCQLTFIWERNNPWHHLSFCQIIVSLRGCPLLLYTAKANPNISPKQK